MMSEQQGTPGMENVLSDLSRLWGGHLNELAADLGQTKDLLHAAIAHLMAEFDGLNQALQIQKTLMQQALQAQTSPAQTPPTQTSPTLSSEMQAARLAALAGEVQSRVHGMVTGLQFEDMTTQLIARSQARVIGLAGMLAALDSCGPDTTSTQLQLHLRQTSSALSSELEKSISQQRMEGGDVELF